MIAWNCLEVPAKIFIKGAKTGALPQNGLSYFNILMFLSLNILKLSFYSSGVLPFGWRSTRGVWLGRPPAPSDCPSVASLCPLGEIVRVFSRSWRRRRSWTSDPPLRLVEELLFILVVYALSCGGDLPLFCRRRRNGVGSSPQLYRAAPAVIAWGRRRRRCRRCLRDHPRPLFLGDFRHLCDDVGALAPRDASDSDDLGVRGHSDC